MKESCRSIKLRKLKYGPYSNSKIKMFEECPYKFEQWYILKNRPPYIPKAFFEKGSYIHWILQHFPNLPEERFRFKLATKDMQSQWLTFAKKLIMTDEIKNILARRIKAEKKFGLGITKEPVGTASKFIAMDGNSKLCALMGYIDHIGMADDDATYCIYDWKTGTSRVVDRDQLMLYALWFLKISANVDKVKTGFIYVENLADNTYETYTQDDVQMLTDYFINKIVKVETATNFEKTPSQKGCKYCDYFSECGPMKFQRKQGV